MAPQSLGSDGVAGALANRDEQAFEKIGDRKWARRVVGAGGRDINAAVLEVLTEMVYLQRAIVEGLNRIGDLDLLGEDYPDNS